MIDAPKLLAALQVLEPELPALLGADDWATLEGQVQALIEALSAGELGAGQLPAQVLRAFRAFPAAHERLLRQLQSALPSEPTDRAWDLTAISRLLHPPVARRMDLHAPSRVGLDSPRLLVVLRLRLPTDPSARGPEIVYAAEGLGVQVGIDAPDFEVLGAAWQETIILKDQDSPPVVFDLKPRRVGAWRVNVDLYQGGHTLGSLSLPVEVVPAAPEAEVLADARGDLCAFSGGAPPERTLRVSMRPAATGCELGYELLDPNGGIRFFRPVALREGVQTHVDRLFKELRELARGQGWAPEGVDRALRVLGQSLWRELLPEDLRRYYLEHRASWQDSALLVHTDEPWVPWELIWPHSEDLRDAWEAEEPWCLSMRLTRWLRHSASVSFQPAPPARLPLNRAAVLAPEDAGLPSAQVERRALLDLLFTCGVQDRGARARRAEVLELLDAGGYDWLHVCAHGSFDAQNAEMDGALRLEEGSSLRPMDLNLAPVSAHIAKQRPAFVLNACHLGRAGWGLGGLAGWPVRLVGFGAGLVVGALWPVRDEAARRFALQLYERLAAGDRLAEAARQARRAARRAGDPTWLAYTVYGHPNAIVELPQKPEAA